MCTLTCRLLKWWDELYYNNDYSNLFFIQQNEILLREKYCNTIFQSLELWQNWTAKGCRLLQEPATGWHAFSKITQVQSPSESRHKWLNSV